jgi:hypothetical protein
MGSHKYSSGVATIGPRICAISLSLEYHRNLREALAKLTVAYQMRLFAMFYNLNIHCHYHKGTPQRSRYSDLLRAGRSGDRIPVGARFSTLVQTSPRAYPASCTMGTGSFLEVKPPGRGVDHPPHLAPSLKKE